MIALYQFFLRLSGHLILQFQVLLYCRNLFRMGFLAGSNYKNPPAMQETWVRSLGWEDLLEKGTATDSTILAWRIPWTEEAGGLQSMGSQRVGHD